MHRDSVHVEGSSHLGLVYFAKICHGRQPRNMFQCSLMKIFAGSCHSVLIHILTSVNQLVLISVDHRGATHSMSKYLVASKYRKLI